MELLTFGHGTASADEIVALLRDAGLRSVVDVRTAPGSRRNPHVARAELERWLPEHGFAYRWERRLGGFRKVPADSPDVVWRVDAFRAYAGYTRDPTFLEAVDELLDAAAAKPTTVMCSESVWWRCHRRIIADFVALAREVPVRHLMHDGRLVPHQPSDGVRMRADRLLVYDAGQDVLEPLCSTSAAVAGDRDRERTAQSLHALRAEQADSMDEPVLAQQSQVVQRRDALAVDPVGGTETNRRRDVADGSSQRRHQHRAESSASEVTVHDNRGPWLVHLGKPDLAAPGSLTSQGLTSPALRR